MYKQCSNRTVKTQTIFISATLFVPNTRECIFVLKSLAQIYGHYAPWWRRDCMTVFALKSGWVGAKTCPQWRDWLQDLVEEQSEIVLWQIQCLTPCYHSYWCLLHFKCCSGSYRLNTVMSNRGMSPSLYQNCRDPLSSLKPIKQSVPLVFE